MTASIPFAERPPCSREEANQALGGVGDTTFYRLANEGKLELRKIGNKTLVTTASVLRLASSGDAPAKPRRPPVPPRRRPLAPDDDLPPAV